MGLQRERELVQARDLVQAGELHAQQAAQTFYRIGKCFRSVVITNVKPCKCIHPALQANCAKVAFTWNWNQSWGCSRDYTSAKLRSEFL